MNLFTIMDDINYVADNFCSTKNVLTVFKICGYLLLILRLCVPIIIIVMGTLKFYNVVTSSSGSQDSFSKELKSLLFRVAIGIFVFFVPTIVHATLYNFISDESKMCEVCLLKPSKCGSSDEDVINRGNTDNKGESVPNCELRSASERYCENKSGCKWNKNKKTCEFADSVDYRKENCDGYYDATSDECVKKSNITCATFSGEKAKCKNLSKSYGLTCSFNEVSFECSEDTSTTIEPSNGNNNNNNNNNSNNTVVSDISKFPKDSLNCWQHGYDTCSGVCKWSGENAGTGGCRSASEVSESIVKDVCSLATDRDQCTSLDSYCEWTTYSCAPYSE